MLTTMRAIILLVHGNKRTQTREHFDRVAEQLAERIGLPVESILLAASESLDIQINRFESEWTRKQVVQVDVVPMLLGPGRHLEDDVPLLVGSIERRFPHWAVRVSSMLGDWPELIDALTRKLS